MREAQKISLDLYMRNFSFLSKLAAIVLLLDMIAVSIVVESVFTIRMHSQERAAQFVDGYSDVLSEAVSGAVGRLDLALSICVSEMESLLSKSGDTAQIDLFLRRQMKHLPEAKAFRIVNEKGIIVYGVGPTVPSGHIMTDREYFIKAKENPESSLIISNLLTSRINGELAVIFVKPIRMQDGSFWGIAYIGVALKQMTSFLKAPGLGNFSVVTLIDKNGNIVARNPPLKNEEEREHIKNKFKNIIVDIFSSGKSKCTFKGISPVDSMSRVVTWNKQKKFPGYLIVGTSEEHFSSEWQEKVPSAFLLLFLFLIMTFSGAYWIYSSWKCTDKLSKEFANQARTDILTGCATRRFFMELLETERNRVIRSLDPFSLLILDLDHFKLINDKYGHPVGDQVLCHFVTLVEQAIRQSDRLGRMGGEEFAILLPETRLSAAKLIAERICSEVASTPLNIGNAVVKMTVSIGVAEWTPQDKDSFEGILARSDAALYAAKNNGRNTVRTEHTLTDSSQHS